MAIWLGPRPNLPGSLKDVNKAATFLDYTDRELIPFCRTLKPEYFILKVVELTRVKIPDVRDGNTRANITLRLWAGCFDSAKAIRKTYAHWYRDEKTNELKNEERPITPEIRKMLDKQMQPKSEEDALYKYGVESGTGIRKISNQPVYLAGIPKESIIRKYVKKGKEGDVIYPEDKLLEG